MNYEKIGVIGAGVIGSAVIEYVTSKPELELDFVLVEEGFDESKVPPSIGRYLTSDPNRIPTSTDLIIEAANPEVLATLAPIILQQADLCAFSCAALADHRLEQELKMVQRMSDRKLFIPHGAILGLDGIADGKDAIESVTITTTKNGKSLGQTSDAKGIIFEGSTREACLRFPRNVNVHATVALAGIGFDETHSRVIADPSSNEMRHHISVIGQGFVWNIEVSSNSLGGVSGAFTPRSAVGSVQRLLSSSTISNC